MRVALAHDYFFALGGAEQTVAVMRGLWPEAPVFTSFVDRGTFPLDIAGWDVRTSFLQRVPHPARVQKFLTPLYPLAFRSFDMDSFDIVVSSASFAAKGIPRRPRTLHISYCYTPPRFLWGLTPATDRRESESAAARSRRSAQTAPPALGQMGGSAAAPHSSHLTDGGRAHTPHIRQRGNRHLSAGSHAPLLLAALPR